MDDRSDSAAGPDALAALVRRARRARAAAYAEYSGYAVGAAVLTGEGAVHVGCNVENALYGATMCAERVAVFGAVAAGARRIVAVAVATPGGGTPCGFCRQVLAEFAAPETPVAITDALVETPEDEESPYRVLQLGDLLPEAWTTVDLERGREAEG